MYVFKETIFKLIAQIKKKNNNLFKPIRTMCHLKKHCSYTESSKNILIYKTN